MLLLLIIYLVWILLNSRFMSLTIFLFILFYIFTSITIKVISGLNIKIVESSLSNTYPFITVHVKTCLVGWESLSRIFCRGRWTPRGSATWPTTCSRTPTYLTDSTASLVKNAAKKHVFLFCWTTKAQNKLWSDH